VSGGCCNALHFSPLLNLFFLVKVIPCPSSKALSSSFFTDLRDLRVASAAAATCTAPPSPRRRHKRQCGAAAAANRVEVGRRVEQELGRTYEKKGYTARNMARNFRHAIHNSNNNKKYEMPQD
jgi:hypothetical protein